MENQKANKILLLDLDTITENPLSSYQIHDQTIININQALKQFAEYHWFSVGISNQDQVASGQTSLETAITQQHHILALLPQLEEILFCPDLEGQDCWLIRRQLGTFDPACQVLDGAIAISDMFKHNEHYICNKYKGNFLKPKTRMLDLAIDVNHIHDGPDLAIYVSGLEGIEIALAAGIPFFAAQDWIAHPKDILNEFELD